MKWSLLFFFFFSSRRRHTRSDRDWSSDVCSSDLRTFARIMMEQKYGKIVNLASVAWLGNIGQTNYSASKAGVVGMTRTWALELARYNINVNAIAPGLIDSALTQQIPAEVKEKFIAR